MVVIAVSGAAIVFVAGALLVPSLVGNHIGPSNFWPVGIERAGAGSTGCLFRAGEACYAVTFGSAFQGLTLDDLHFVVANGSLGSTTSGPIAPPLPLGAGARVTVLSSASSIAGVWNVSGNRWISGADWPIPTTQLVTVVLDTGLDSNATLADAEFAIVHTSPYEGSVGFPLYCAGC